MRSPPTPLVLFLLSKLREQEAQLIERDRAEELRANGDLSAASDEALVAECRKRGITQIRVREMAARMGVPEIQRESTTTTGQVMDLAAELANRGGRGPWELSLPPREFEALNTALESTATHVPRHFEDRDLPQSHLSTLAATIHTPFGAVSIRPHSLAPTGGVMISTRPPYDFSRWAPVTTPARLAFAQQLIDQGFVDIHDAEVSPGASISTPAIPQRRTQTEKTRLKANAAQVDITSHTYIALTINIWHRAEHLASSHGRNVDGSDGH